MKFKLALILYCGVFYAFAYNQSDLLNAQYAYQNANDKVTLAKTEKLNASQNLIESKQKLDDAKKSYKDALKQLSEAQVRYANAESNLIQTNKDFAKTNLKLKSVWNSLNSN